MAAQYFDLPDGRRMREIDAQEAVALATRPLVKGVTADLTGIHVRGPLDLRGAALGNVDFSGSLFEGPVRAEGARFPGLAWFKGCRFEGGADFSACVFGSDLRFDGARCAGAAVFARAQFLGVADLTARGSRARRISAR